MNEQQREHVSALLDGELPQELVEPSLRALDADPEMRAAWERYHLIGSILREEPVHPEYRSIATRVRARLQAEKIVPLPQQAGADRSSRWRAWGGIGLAAAAAFLTVFAAPRFFSSSPWTEEAQVTTSMALPQKFSLAAGNPQWRLDQPELEQKLDRFLVNHQLRSPATHLQGFLPYATVVGYEAGY